MTPDPDHPTIEGMARRLLAEHSHDARHDATDEWVTLTTRAVLVEFSGPGVELGPWSFSPDEARLLAASLTILADRCEPA